MNSSDPFDAVDLGEAFDQSIRDLQLALYGLEIPDSVPPFTLVCEPTSEKELRAYVDVIVNAAGFTTWPPSIQAVWDRMKRAGDLLGTRLIEHDEET